MNNRQKNIIHQYFKNRKIYIDNQETRNNWTKYESEYSNKDLNFKEYWDIFVDDEDRALYYARIFNKKQNKYKYIAIYKFKFVNDTIALAKFDNGKKVFINKDGIPTIEGITEAEMENNMTDEERATYFNQKSGEYEYEYVHNFDLVNHTIALTQLFNKKHLFINKEGKPSIEGFTVENINEDLSDEERIIYFKQKTGKNFEYVGLFMYVNNTLAEAVIDDINYFINFDGNPSIKGLENELKELSSTNLAIYFNQKLKKEAYDDVYFISNTDILFAVIENYSGPGSSKFIFIDKEGKPTLDGITEDIIKNKFNNLQRATYFNQKLKKDIYYNVNIFAHANKTLAVATFNNNSYPKFINIKGEPSLKNLENIDLNNLTNYERAAYFNTKLKKDAFEVVSPFNIVNNTLAIANIGNDEMIFINKEGKPSLDEINEKELGSFNEKYLKIYFNQKINKTDFYQRVKRVILPNKFLYIANLLEYYSHYVFIGIKSGKPSVEDVVEDDIPHFNQYEVKAYFNQKFKHEFFKEIFVPRNNITDLKGDKYYIGYLSPKYSESDKRNQVLISFNGKIFLNMNDINKENRKKEYKLEDFVNAGEKIKKIIDESK